MRRIIVFLLLFAFAAVCVTTSCKHKPQVAVVPPDGGYPDAVAKIILNNCINAGCHNEASYQTSTPGLLLDTWEHLFNGSNYGAEVVPYNTKFSPLLYYVNNAFDTGVNLYDVNHLASLTLAEYTTLKNWIASGAPDKNGNIPFATNADTRQKIYLSNQGCDLVAVVDAKSRLLMRYIPIGTISTQIESPHGIEVSADGKFAYVPLYSGHYVQKIDTRTDTVAGGTDMSSVTLGGPAGVGQWSVVYLSPLDTAFLVSGYTNSGSLVTINTATMQINPHLSIDQVSGGGSLFPSPHGVASNAGFDTFYATLQTNFVKYTFNGGFLHPWFINASGNPHQIAFTPDRSKYFVTCPDAVNPANNFVRVYDTHTDALISAITVGNTPQEMSVSKSKNYLFVSCMEDADNPMPGAHGSVYVIDMTTLSIVKKIYGDFYQPHGVTVDEQDGLVFISSRNLGSGPAPHHSTSCGTSGWYSVYDLNTLNAADNKRYYVAHDPYGIATRFK